MNENERKLQYKEHRRRVENAKSRVNSQAPRPKKPDIIPREMTFFDLMKALFKHRRQQTYIRSPIRMRSAMSIHWKKKSNYYGYGGGGGSGRSGRSGHSAASGFSGRSGYSDGIGDCLTLNSGKSVPPTISGTISKTMKTKEESPPYSPLSASDYDSHRSDHINGKRVTLNNASTPAGEMKKSINKIKDNNNNKDTLRDKLKDKDKSRDTDRDKDKDKDMVKDKIKNKIKYEDNDKVMDKGKENIDNMNNVTKSNAIPQYVLKRYHYLSFLDNTMLRKLLRPSIFLDIELKNDRHLGRMIIQLYTEACPEVVCQFVQICTQCDRMRINFTRLYPPLWLEGELILNDYLNAYTIPSIEYDAAAINHGSSGGILSFPSRYLRGSKYRFISFTVSFKPADVLNGKRIGFGRLKRGQKILNLLQTVNVTRNGRPVKDIVVADCGVL